MVQLFGTGIVAGVQRYDERPKQAKLLRVEYPVNS